MPNSKAGKEQEYIKIVPNSVDACNKPILVVNYDGKNYVSVTSVAHNMGLAEHMQRRLVKNHPIMCDHYEYFDITLTRVGLEGKKSSFEMAHSPTAVKDEEKLIPSHRVRETQTHLFLEYEFLYGLLFVTRMSPIKAVKKAQIEYQREAFKVLHNYFHKKYNGEMPSFLGKAEVENFEAIKAQTIRTKTIHLSSEGKKGFDISYFKLLFLDEEVETYNRVQAIPNNKAGCKIVVYFKPKDICKIMGISYDIQENVILNDCLLSKHCIFKDKYTSDLLLELDFFYVWLNHINHNKVGMSKKKVVNQKAVDTIEAIQAKSAEAIHKELGKELKK